MSDEILHDFSPMVRLYKDGQVERLKGLDVVPAGIDPLTGIQSKDVHIAPDQNVSARLYLPNNVNPGKKLPLLLYFHGGGFVIESAFSPVYQNHLNSLVAEANVVAVSVNYRLAPEYPLPTCYEDCWLALKWVAHRTDEWLKEYADYDRVYLGGDSAGGNIAHNMAIRAGSEKLDGVNINGVILNYPYFGGKEPIGKEVDNVKMKEFPDKLWLTVYPTCSGLDDPAHNPAADPKLSSLGCKRVLVYVAEKDVLRDRGWYYKEALSKSGWGGHVDFVEVQGEDHVFNLFAPTTPKAVSVLKKMASFLNGGEP